MKRRNLSLSVGLPLIILGLFIGCQQTPVDPELGLHVQETNSLVLGKKLENPYSVSNIQRARDSLVARGILSKTTISDPELSPTHYYIRFKPTSEDDVYILKSDTSMILWDYPLDYELLEGGTSYRDPEIPEGMPGYLYTAVSVAKALPSVPYEILEQLILAPEGEDVALQKKAIFVQYSILEREALRITGNGPKEDVAGLSKAMAEWRPTGRVTVTDNVLNVDQPVVTRTICDHLA